MILETIDGMGREGAEGGLLLVLFILSHCERKKYNLRCGNDYLLMT